MKKCVMIVFKSLLFFIGWIVLFSFVPDITFETPALLRWWWEFIPFVAIVLMTVFFVFIIEKGKLKIPLFSKGVSNTIIGCLIGLIWIGSGVGILLLTGNLYFEGRNSVDFIWVWIFSSFINVIMQELLIRGYLYQLYKSKYNRITASIVTTIIFVALHGGAIEAGVIAILNVITMSIFMTVLLEYTETLLAPIMAHFIWNTVGAIILGGVTLAEDYPRLLNGVFSGNTLLSGGSYKLEGSIVVLSLNIVFILITLNLTNKKLSRGLKV